MPTEGEFALRPGDLDRLDTSLREQSRGIADLTARVTDMRVLMADGYVKKSELEVAKAELRKETAEGLAGLRAAIADNSTFIKWIVGISTGVQAIVVSGLAAYIAFHH